MLWQIVSAHHDPTERTKLYRSDSALLRLKHDADFFIPLHAPAARREASSFDKQIFEGNGNFAGVSR
jgi:hypothetical protein